MRSARDDLGVAQVDRPGHVAAGIGLRRAHDVQQDEVDLSPARIAAPTSEQSVSSDRRAAKWAAATAGRGGGDGGNKAHGGLLVDDRRLAPGAASR
jgi:hypothetical protein